MKFSYKTNLGLILICLLLVTACDSKEDSKPANQTSTTTQNLTASDVHTVDIQQDHSIERTVDLTESLQQLQLEVNNIKKQTKFPLKLAQDLSLDRVDFYTAKTPIVRYEYTYLNILSSDQKKVEKIKSQKIDIARVLLKNMCANPRSDALKKDNVLLEYQYKTKDQQELIYFLLDLNKSCPKRK